VRKATQFDLALGAILGSRRCGARRGAQEGGASIPPKALERRGVAGEEAGTDAETWLRTAVGQFVAAVEEG
jgi:hypothetical protein